MTSCSFVTIKSIEFILHIYLFTQVLIYFPVVSFTAPCIHNFMTSYSFATIKFIESVISVYSSNIYGKLKESLEEWKTSLIVFGEIFLNLASSKSRKSNDIDMEFYPHLILNKEQKCVCNFDKTFISKLWTFL